MLDAYLLSFASTWTGHLHSLDPLGTRWSRLKRVTEILGLADNLFILKFHDTNRIRWLPIVSEDEFGHPEIGSTNNSPHRKSLVVRLETPEFCPDRVSARPIADTQAPRPVDKFDVRHRIRWRQRRPSGAPERLECLSLSS